MDDLSPGDEDTVVEGERGLDIFASTNLDFILRSKDIHTVALGGFLTNCCVESTMRSATSAGYDVAPSLTASPPPQVEHDNAILYDYLDVAPTHPAAGASRTNRLADARCPRTPRRITTSCIRIGRSDTRSTAPDITSAKPG